MMRALVFALVFSLSRVALADDVDAARAAFEKGAALAEEGRWSDALAQFEASAKLRPHAQTYYDIGYCERALGQATRARKHFSLALSREAELTPELRASTIKYLAEMRALIATPSLTVLPEGAVVSVDGHPLEADGDHMLAGTRPPGPGERVPKATFSLEIDAGDHEIVVIAPDGHSKIAHEHFDAGTSKHVTVDATTPKIVRPERPVPKIEKSYRAPIGLAVAGVGAVAIGVGAYFGLSARSTWADAKDACPDLTRCPNEDGARLSTSAQRKANVSTFAILGGAAALGGGLILYLTAPRMTVSAEPAKSGAFVRLSTAF